MRRPRDNLEDSRLKLDLEVSKRGKYAQLLFWHHALMKNPELKRLRIESHPFWSMTQALVWNPMLERSYNK